MVKSRRAKRMGQHHKRNKATATLNLVSLMDIFTILVFFLLVNSSDVEVLPNDKDIQLPESIAEEKAKETVVMTSLFRVRRLQRSATCWRVAAMTFPSFARRSCRKTTACCVVRPRMTSPGAKSQSWVTGIFRTDY